MKDMPQYIIENGTKIQVDPVLGSTTGILVKPKYLEARQASVKGTVRGVVGGHGGDIYWVEHDDDPGTIAVYGWPEFEVIPKSRYEVLMADETG